MASKLTRRDFVKGAALAAALPTLPQAPVVKQSVLAHLDTIKVYFKPVSDYLNYLEQAARGGEADPDLLVILWDRAHDATCNDIPRVFETTTFEREVIYPLVGEDAYRQACARNMPGFEL